jgi:acylpyruvate hydrolase
MFGLVTYRIDLPFGRATRLGAISRPGWVIDLRAACQAWLAAAQGDTQAGAIAAVRIPDTMVGLVEGGRFSLDAARSAVAYADSHAPGETVTTGGDRITLSLPLDQVELLPPLQPGKMVCAGRNYAAHAAQSTMPAVDDYPRGFIKVNSSLIGPTADLVYPPATEQLEFEVELAVIIGTAGRDIAKDRAYDHVFGYTVFNDLSARDWQFSERTKGNHLLGKNLDALGVLGPMLVPKEFVPDPMQLALSLQVNGTPRQQARTSGMIFDIPTQIAHWSRMTLLPGDLVATGTPESLGRRDEYLKPGDLIEAEVEGIGRQRNRVVPSPSRAGPAPGPPRM